MSFSQAQSSLVLVPSSHCLHGSKLHQRNMGFFDGKPKFLDKDPMVENCLISFQVALRVANMLQVHPRALTSESSLSSETEDNALGDNNDRLIGGNDISMLVRKVPSEPNLEVAVQTIDLVMKRNIRISINTFSALLQRCSRSRDLVSGKKVHEQLLENGYKANVLLANTLIDMYGKCGSVVDAQQVFDEMSKHNIYSWTALISAYANKGMVEAAINLFMEMQKAGNKPDKVVFVVILQACARSGDLEQGKQLHHQIIRSGLASDLMVGNTLIDMYAKCGSLELAHEVFHQMPEQNVVSWTALIAGYARQGLQRETFVLFEQMQEQDIEPNEATFVSVLQACANTMDVERGEHIHSHIIGSGYESDLVVGSSLVDMYVKCENLLRACGTFNKMFGRNIVSWNAMIVGHVQQGLDEEALSLYEQLQEEGLEPADEITLANVIKACSSLAALEEGREVHSEVIKAGYESDTYVGNSLINLYASCKCIHDAKQVFDAMSEQDVVSWIVMIMGYAQQGLAKEAITLFDEMRQEDLVLDIVTFVSLLKTCAIVGALDWGRQIHTILLECGFSLDVFVGSVLIDMYVKCGSIVDARLVLYRMPKRDVVSYTAMIAGLAQQGLGKEALPLFEIMLLEGLEPDRLTFVSILQACASLAALEKGKQVHTHIVDSGFEMDVFVANTLVDMYAKCGSMDLARRLFSRMPERNVVSWNALITGYSQQGFGKEALALFKKMLEEDLKPTEVTLVSVLSGCSHAGLVDEGQYYFDSMQDYGITPTMDHYACMVDLLCRAGHMVEAEGFIKEMPIEPSEVVWMTLACAYKLYGKVELAKHAIEKALKLNPQNLSAYVLLSNIFAAAGKWDDKNKVRQMMDNQGVVNIPEHSCIEVNNHLYTFTGDDTSHPQTKEINAELRRLEEEMKKAGHAPDSSLALQNVEDAEKGLSLCCHTEKLAIALGLISTPANESIRVIKNLSVCANCHTSTKFISKFTGREILVRDANCFHLFKDGNCSCGDYW